MYIIISVIVNKPDVKSTPQICECFPGSQFFLLTAVIHLSMFPHFQKEI